MAKKTQDNSIIKDSVPTALGFWQADHDDRQLHRLVWLGWDGSRQVRLSEFARKIQTLINIYADTGDIDQKVVSSDLRISPFQFQVYRQLCRIPGGQTETYGEVAKIINSSPRAVGQACRSNPIQLFIPCHRVVGKTGLGGYMGKQKNDGFKLLLLNHEANVSPFVLLNNCRSSSILKGKGARHDAMDELPYIDNPYNTLGAVRSGNISMGLRIKTEIKSR